MRITKWNNICIEKNNSFLCHYFLNRPIYSNKLHRHFELVSIVIKYLLHQYFPTNKLNVVESFKNRNKLFKSKVWKTCAMCMVDSKMLTMLPNLPWTQHFFILMMEHLKYRNVSYVCSVQNNSLAKYLYVYRIWHRHQNLNLSVDRAINNTWYLIYSAFVWETGHTVFSTPYSGWNSQYMSVLTLENIFLCGALLAYDSGP